MSSRFSTARGQVLDRDLLHGEADAATDGGGVLDDIEPDEPGGAGRRAEQRRQDPDRRRLAGAVRAEEAEEAAPLHAERHAVDRADIALVHLDQVAHVDDRVLDRRRCRSVGKAGREDLGHWGGRHQGTANPTRRARPWVCQNGFSIMSQTSTAIPPTPIAAAMRGCGEARTRASSSSDAGGGGSRFFRRSSNVATPTAWRTLFM